MIKIKDSTLQLIIDNNERWALRDELITAFVMLDGDSPFGMYSDTEIKKISPVLYNLFMEIANG